HLDLLSSPTRRSSDLSTTGDPGKNAPAVNRFVPDERCVIEYHETTSDPSSLMRRVADERAIRQRGSRIVKSNCAAPINRRVAPQDRKSTRLNSSHVSI